MNNTKRCCMRDCMNEAEGYYVTSSWGLWLCSKCKCGRKTADITDIRNNPDKKHLHDMEV